MNEQIHHSPNYVEVVKYINAAEYPLPQAKVKEAVQLLMNELSSRKKQNSFLFYCQTFQERNISPLTVNLDTYLSPDKQIRVKRNYITDIAADKTDNGWVLPDNDDQLLVPQLQWNNLFFLFQPFDPIFYSTWEKYKKKFLIDEYLPLIQEKLQKKNLLHGDVRFASSSLKRFLSRVDSEFKGGWISKKPSAAEIEKIKGELDERNHLRYVNLQGEEIRPKKTRFEAWEEFKEENPDLLQELIEICFLPSPLKTQKDRLTPLIDKAFTLLRVKGFAMYPDLTA